MPTARRLQATVLYHTSETWHLEKRFDLNFEKLPRRCYVFLPVEIYPESTQERLPILRHFDAPPVLATKMCTEINGYFGSRSKYDENERLRNYSTWMRCLVKMILEEALPNGKDYKWNEMTFLTRWDCAQKTHQVLCVDTPDHFPLRMLDALRGQGTGGGESHMLRSSGVDYFNDPFSMHAPLLDQVVEWNDESVWAIRHPIRVIEKKRPESQPDFEAMHEISRHSIHVSEVLLVTIQNFEMLREQQTYMHNQCGFAKEYREQAHEYLNFQIQMLRSLRERSISNHSRLTSEITVSFFSTTFFTFGEEGLQASKQMWLYWVVTIPSTLLVVVFWRLLLHRSAPMTLEAAKIAAMSMFKRRRDRKKEKKNEKEKKKHLTAIMLTKAATRLSSFKRKFVLRAETLHARIPAIKKVPLPALGIISLIAFINLLVWAACGVVLHFYPSLVSTAAISYSLGLRHALDADHISAIDLMTRRLLAGGQRPVTVGTFFSLGHSTIVIITSIVVAATAAAVSSRFNGFSTVGGIIGTAVSASVLILLGLMNAYILYKLVQQMRRVLPFYRHRLRQQQGDGGIDGDEGALVQGESENDIWKIEGGGFLFSILRKLFVLIDRPWKMYPLGVLFGLGFDTSSEIALLGISSVEASRQSNFWVILIFPILFTAGMCLIDTTDGALMLSLYVQPAANFLPSTPAVETQAGPAPETEQVSGQFLTESSPPGISDENGNQQCPSPQNTDITNSNNGNDNQRDPVAFLYYSIVLTTLTVLVALVIGILQVLSLVWNVTGLTGPFWHGVEIANDYYDAIGGGICGCFVIVGTMSVVCYKPWRRWVGIDGDVDNATTSTDLERQANSAGEKGCFSAGGVCDKDGSAIVSQLDAKV
ncbi:hypothetical protein UA08_03621 [Talaromyces atroroseus]|uniref:Nickel/cobalt efflux system n=1 Tax=Talaromyces atroroseus TaxID=1441469 RepID=A0A225AZS1_TALAT|nr:hypothetical protein UA08_03621 [Talaromyces atroroseus]OKL61209.1 hypothetical protein UA08_03621 [Talaromyces atroroseus]